MGKQIVIIFITVISLALLSFSVSVNAAQNTMSKTFEDFDLEEYRAILAKIAETEQYPHFLEGNKQRYEDYQADNPDLQFDVVIAHVNVNIDREPYEDVQLVADPGRMTVLVNKHFSLPADWEPNDFTDTGGGHMMREEAAEHFINMREAMRDAGLNLNPVITFRSYERQRNHFNNAVARLGSSAQGGFAKPGHSEHQTGLAIDVLHKGHDGGLMMDMGFENSRQFSWLVENAHEFGFILRYPQGYRQQSGFMFEPWHWRYVGIPVATAMYDDGIALYEEFYGRYLVQGVVDKVNAYLLEQQALAEAAEAAAVAEAEAAAAAELAAAEAAAELAAAELAAMEEAVRIALAEAAAEAEEAARAERAAEIEARRLEASSANKHFIEILIVLCICAAVLILNISRKKKCT